MEGNPTGICWIFNSKTKKIILTWDVTFLQKSCGEYSKVEQHVIVTMSYEGSDDEQKHKTVPVIDNNNKVNIVSDSDSNHHKQ